MKTIFLTMGALAALSAAPAVAQSWNGQRTSADLQMRIDAGVESGAISRRELSPLRTELSRLASLERQYAGNGFSGRERSALQQRGNALRRQIAMAERNGPYDRRADRDYRDDDDRYADSRWDNDRREANDRYADSRWDNRAERERQAEWDARHGQSGRYGLMSGFDLPNTGDRFVGDARVGQRVSSRMVALPVQYRSEFQDNADVYYRYDDDRIYRVNRSTNVIMSLLDLPN